MYATFPLEEVMISWGSWPTGTRPSIFKLVGSTIARESSLFSRTSNAGDGVCAAAHRAVNTRSPKANVRKNKDCRACRAAMSGSPFLGANHFWECAKSAQQYYFA